MASSTVGSVRVLHVDDEPDFAQMAGEFISRHDERLEVTTATSASEALDRLEQKEYDCIVSDYDMPGQNGIEFLEAVRDDYPDLPFILYTGKGSEEVASEAISAGVSDYLQKQSGTSQYEVLTNRITHLVEKQQAEHQLRDREERLNLFFEQSPFGVIRWDDEFNFARLNDKAREILGYEEGELVGEPWHTVIPEEDFEEIADVVVEDLLADEGGYHSVNENVRKDGERITCEWHNWVVKDNDDEVVAVFSQFQDITERNERERELQRERDRRAALFENASNPIMEVTFDDETPLITGVNPAFEETFGLAAEAVAQKPVAEVVVPESEREEHEHLKDQVLQGEGVETEVKRETVSGIRDFLLHIIPVESGDLSLGAYAWYIDITEREARAAKITALHAVATELEACETQPAVYERLVEAAEDVLDYDLAIADAVQGDVLVPEAVSSDVASDEYFERTPISASNNLAARAFRTGESSVVDDLRTRGVTPAHSEYRAALTVPIGDYGIFQAVATDPGGFDETDRELAELLCDHARETLHHIEHRQELKRQNERLEEFVSVVSHDLRNPLNVADGRLQLAIEQRDWEELDAVAQALDRMETLIDDMLSLADAGENVGEIETVELAELVESCWQNVPTESATFRMETDVSIQADKSRLQQLIENLLRNAVEHGGSEVTVTVGVLPDGFYVEDDGPGIPEEARAEVLEPGYSSSEAGTGFGLSIVRDIAHAHGWVLRIVDSDEGGARFEFTGVEIESGGRR